MKCFVCHRRLIRCAVPGLQIGPKCARDRGYLGASEPRPLIVSRTRRARTDTQVDWINLLIDGQAGGDGMPTGAIPLEAIDVMAARCKAAGLKSVLRTG